VDTLAGPATVVVIEDESDLREAACEFLRGAGFVAIPARNGVDALNLLRRRGRPSVILLDLTMPVMNGYEFLCFLRQDHVLQSVPVVVTSAIDDLPDGARYLLRKPYEVRSLVEVLARCCVEQVDQDLSSTAM
jgi:two-component system, chemotaxis family, chemotaxis protein CheY